MGKELFCLMAAISKEDQLEDLPLIEAITTNPTKEEKEWESHVDAGSIIGRLKSSRKI